MVKGAVAVVDTFVGRARFAGYLAACGGDAGRAVALYQWNAELTAAVWVPLGHVEVALRNTINHRMGVRHRRLGRGGHWIFDDARELGRDARGAGRHDFPYSDLDTALRRVRKNSKPQTPDQIISEVSFGFLHQMVSAKQMRAWPDLAGGFPHAPSRDQLHVRSLVSDIRDLRNRMGHHHRIWTLDVAARHSGILTLAGYMDPELRVWIEDRSAVPDVLAQHP